MRHYWVQTCDCEGHRAMLKPLHMQSKDDRKLRRVTISFSVGQICCAVCATNWREVVEEENGRSTMQSREDAAWGEAAKRAEASGYAGLVEAERLMQREGL